jgi:hypothetical protein
MDEYREDIKVALFPTPRIRSCAVWKPAQDRRSGKAVGREKNEKEQREGQASVMPWSNTPSWRCKSVVVNLEVWILVRYCKLVAGPGDDARSLVFTLLLGKNAITCSGLRG